MIFFPSPLAPSSGANCGARGWWLAARFPSALLEHCRGFRRHGLGLVAHVLCALRGREAGGFKVVEGESGSKAGQVQYSMRLAPPQTLPHRAVPYAAMRCGARVSLPGRVSCHAHHVHPLAEVWRVRALRLRRRLFMRRGWAGRFGEGLGALGAWHT